MAYLKVATLPMTCFAHASKKQATSKRQQHQDSGSIPGDPFNFVSSLTIGIEYAGERHAHHLRKILQEHYEISEDWDGTKFAGIDLKWMYTPKHVDRTCRLSIKNYIANLLLKFGHTKPLKPQHAPHKNREITYGAKVQLAHEEPPSSALNAEGIKRVQATVGAGLLYGRAVL